MIRIASLVPYRVMPAKMGGQKAIYFFLKYFSRHCDVICYTTKNNSEQSHEPFIVKKILGTHNLRYINPAYFFKLKSEFRKEKITHLLMEQPYYGWLAILLKITTGVKLIIHSHNIEGLRFRSTGKWWWRIMTWYERTVHKNADFNFFITEEDLLHGVKNFGIPKEKCAVITYGSEKNAPPSIEEKKAAKKEICKQLGIAGDNYLLLFNGALNYLPNKKGLDYILKHINPMLLQQKDIRYTIIICGPLLSPEYNELKDYRDRNIVYAGFVNEIDTYFKAADIFINPVTDGGGIKTKLVEALAAGCSAVSFVNGAIGVPAAITGNKLRIVPDYDSKAFCKNIIAAAESVEDRIPMDFFNHFYWDNIARQASDIIKTNL
ncbi:glycosyltransferase family 4 protein [Terrimonas pollutisoli]|uniref:glycosyltransferase family 4 protein n=1 Tax=Terrimonas pollutisoli TaxID=3034147 RepID=UPI0023EC1C49|nr:glycosyltransferase family 4 protein [Terrimonas sp. H1YJ31]